MDDKNLREIAASVYGTCATEQDIEFARRLLAAADAAHAAPQPARDPGPLVEALRDVVKQSFWGSQIATAALAAWEAK